MPKPKKLLVLHKSDWNIIVKNGKYFEIIHRDDFESDDEFKAIKVGTKVEIWDRAYWWRMKFSTMKKIIKKAEK